MMRKYPIVFFIALISIVFFIGCSKSLVHNSSNTLSEGLISSGYRIADTLMMNAKHRLDSETPIIVASFVNVNNLEESSTFGRIIAEQISSRFSQNGFKVREVKLRNKSLYMEKGKGEFLLSRDLNEVSRKHNASALVVGTYGNGSRSILVSARVVNPEDGLIISSCDYKILMHPKTMRVVTRSN
jgi:TolB-like protein